MAERAASPSRCSDFPPWVLLDTVAHIGHCENETTAHGTTSAGLPIQVSFELAAPPDLSRCVVNCSDLTLCNYAESPRVTGADGAFLLIRVFFPKRDDMFTDLFVYRAGPGKPSLYCLPPPYPLYLHSNCVGVLSCGESSNHCLVVVPERQIGPDNRLRYDLHVFSTKSKTWSIKDPLVASGADMCSGEFDPTKVFSVAGGSLAWVDLRFGILLCKKVDQDPEMILMQLPELMPDNKEEFGVNSDDSCPPMDPIRDVTFSRDRFRIIEMESMGSSNDSQQQWTATIFEMSVCSENWEYCCTVDSNLVPSDSCFPYLFPEIYDYKEFKLTLNRMISLLPTLDQYDDNVVYMISKRNAIDTSGWILAVNIRDKKLEKLVPFSAETLHYHQDYKQCSFSKYLINAPASIYRNVFLC